VRGDPTLVKSLLQIDPFQELHRHVQLVPLLPEVVNRHDVRMVQEGGRLGLTLEAPPQRVVVVARLHHDDLDGDEAVEGGVVSLVDGARRALADFGDDLVFPELLQGFRE
jgi:hypothetical protein